MFAYLVVGLDFQEQRRDHADSFLSADVTLQRNVKQSSEGCSSDADFN